MTNAVAQLDAWTGRHGLRSRCAELGLPLITVGADGEVVGRQLRQDAPLACAAARSAMLEQALRSQLAEWNEIDDPPPAPMWPGCWAIPVPIAQRRRRIGYHVAIMFTAELAESEHLHRLCDAAGLDYATVAQRIVARCSRGVDEVIRTATLLRWMAGDLHQIEQHAEGIDALSRQLGESYEELSLVYKLSAHMTVTQDPRIFLQDALDELQQVTALQWAAIQLSDADVRLKALRGAILFAGSPPSSTKRLGDAGRALIERFGQGKPTVVDDTAALDIDALRDMAGQMLIVPILFEGRPLAVLFGADKQDGREINSVDLKLLTSTAQNAGIFLENAMLYEDMQDMFMGTLRSLIASIDAKDTYTCGHSERVAWLSRQLAEAAGLDTQTVERVYLAGLVHDVGKIGVPEAVLTKAGRLTLEEFEMIKAHPEIGARILKDIRQMDDLIPGVLYHHERWSGGGYPRGLQGHDIPLFGRVICLADSFDAMSSDRTYRQAMPLPEVLEEVQRCSGSQFDPELAEVFLRLDFSPYYQLVTDHRKRQSPLAVVMGSSA